MKFEERFFGPGNGLRWGTITGGTLAPDVADKLRPFLDLLHNGSEVCALPRTMGDQSVNWYIVCNSSRDERLARDEVRAFVGPSYASRDVSATEFDAADSVEAAVIERYGLAAFRLEIPSSGPNIGIARERARQRLALWLTLRNERPARLGPRIRATGRILRDFEYALSVGDDASATACRQELHAFGRLDGRNLQFLEVRQLAAMRRWQEILALEYLDSLLPIRRPYRVTEAIITAVYVTELEPFEQSLRAREAVQHFGSEIRPRYGELFRSYRGLGGDAVTASFVLAALTDTPPDPELAAAIIGRLGVTSERRPWVQAILDAQPWTTARPATPQAPDLNVARLAFAVGDIDEAVEIALKLPRSIERTSLLLRCAREVGTIDLVRTALEMFGELDVNDRAIIESHPLLARVSADLLQLAQNTGAGAEPTVVPHVPASWSDWLLRITQEEPWPTAVAVAELGAREWNLESLSVNPTAIDEMVNLVSGSRPAWGEEAIRDASPYLVEALLRDGPRPSFRAIYDALLLLLLTDPSPSTPSFRVLIQLIEARLSMSSDASVYAEWVQGLGGVMDRLSSPVVCDLALDALEVLTNVPRPDEVALEAFFGRVLGLFKRWTRRTDALQRNLLARLADELGVPGLSQEAISEESGAGTDLLSTALQGMTLALYSLNERALARAANTLERVYPGIRVSVFSDRVGGDPALRAATQKADVFVIAPASAKHAATDYIERHRPKELVTLYARGQGSSGLLAALRENEQRIQGAPGRRGTRNVFN